MFLSSSSSFFFLLKSFNVFFFDFVFVESVCLISFSTLFNVLKLVFNFSSVVLEYVNVCILLYNE